MLKIDSDTTLTLHVGDRMEGKGLDGARIDPRRELYGRGDAIRVWLWLPSGIAVPVFVSPNCSIRTLKERLLERADGLPGGVSTFCLLRCGAMLLERSSLVGLNITNDSTPLDVVVPSCEATVLRARAAGAM